MYCVGVVLVPPASFIELVRIRAIHPADMAGEYVADIEDVLCCVPALIGVRRDFEERYRSGGLLVAIQRH
jgi:hypothetical protein